MPREEMPIGINSPVEVSGDEVTFSFSDEGSAHVSVRLVIPGLAPLTYDETYEGMKKTTVSLAAKTYKCSLMIAAYRYKALGPTYDTKIVANGRTIATADDAIPKGQPAEFGYGSFTLVVKAS